MTYVSGRVIGVSFPQLERNTMKPLIAVQLEEKQSKVNGINVFLTSHAMTESVLQMHMQVNQIKK